MDRLPLGKCCTKCGEWKLYEEYSRDRRTPDGRCAACKACKKVVARQRYLNNRARLLEQNRRYHEKNSERIKEQKRLRYFRTLEHHRQQARLYREENREALRLYAQRYREENPEYERELWRRNPERFRLKSLRRRAMKAQAEGCFCEEDWHALCASQNHRCACCGEEKPLTVDHIVPLIKGGSNYIDNIQALCISCNSSKGTRIIDYR